jgi:hypothetical protein
MSTDKKFEHQLFEDVVSGKPHDLKKTMMVFSVCSRTEMNAHALAMAIMAWRALKIMPSTAVTMHVGGYDDDPRELWEIPEVVDFVGEFCRRTGAHNHPAVEPISRNWLMACGADPNTKVTVDMISHEEALDQSFEFYKSRLKESP